MRKESKVMNLEGFALLSLLRSKREKIVRKSMLLSDLGGNTHSLKDLSIVGGLRTSSIHQSSREKEFFGGYFKLDALQSYLLLF